MKFTRRGAWLTDARPDAQLWRRAQGPTPYRRKPRLMRPTNSPLSVSRPPRSKHGPPPCRKSLVACPSPGRSHPCIPPVSATAGRQSRRIARSLIDGGKDNQATVRRPPESLIQNRAVKPAPVAQPVDALLALRPAPGCHTPSTISRARGVVPRRCSRSPPHTVRSRGRYGFRT